MQRHTFMHFNIYDENGSADERKCLNVTVIVNVNVIVKYVVMIRNMLFSVIGACINYSLIQKSKDVL